jgi:hypothetical protein
MKFVDIFPNITSSFFEGSSSEWGSIGIETTDPFGNKVFTDEDISKLKTICSLVDQNLNLNDVIGCSLIPGGFFKGSFDWSVKTLDDGIVMQVGSNIVPLSWDEKLKRWVTPANTPLQVNYTETNKVKKPYLELIIDEETRLDISVSWKPFTEITKFVPELMKQINNPTNLPTLLKEAMSIASPMYALIRGDKDLPPTGAIFRVNGFRRVTNDYGVQYQIIIDPRDMPKGDMIDVKGRLVNNNVIRAANTSQNFLSVDGGFEKWSNLAKPDSGFQVILIVTSFRVLPGGDDKISTDHVIAFYPVDKPLPSLKPYTPTLPKMAELAGSVANLLKDANTPELDG